MKHEYILVKETGSVKGAGSDITLAVEGNTSIPTKGYTVFTFDFDFTPVTPTDNYTFVVTLDWDAAIKGLIMGSWEVFKEQRKISVIVYNMSDKALSIPEGYDLINVGLYSKIRFHAVAESHVAGVINLNLSKT